MYRCRDKCVDVPVNNLFLRRAFFFHFNPNNLIIIVKYGMIVFVRPNTPRSCALNICTAPAFSSLYKNFLFHSERPTSSQSQ